MSEISRPAASLRLLEWCKGQQLAGDEMYGMRQGGVVLATRE